MKCDRSRALLPMLVDHELGPIRRRMLARHVRHCTECAAQLEGLVTMQAAIRSNLPYHRAPPGLAARLGAILPREVPPPTMRPWFRAPAIGFGASGLGGVLAGVALAWLVWSGGASGGQAVMMQALIDSHVRSMMADHLTDVATSDRHTVKPWLSARTDVSPPVRDLAAEGFPLVGGRLDYVDRHPAAVVVYRHARHVINLFAWASTGTADTGLHVTQRQGFNIATWRHAGVAYTAVSDLEADQLADFARVVAAER